MTLDGKVIVVTGGASGIGRATAELMASRGAQVVIADLDVDLGMSVEQEVRARGGEVLFVPTDITSRAAVRALVSETCAAYGGIDVLAHVAAMCENTTFLETDDDLWHRTLDVCLTGTFVVNQEVARVMVEQQRGRIINFASTVALTGGPMHAAYSAAKAGVIALSKCMQRELADANIVVMIVAPGATDTPLFRRNHPNGEERPDGQEGRAAGRRSRPPARPEEVADVVGFLAANESAQLLAGQTIHTNGGRFLGF
jgi:NAD(P)-dependent dehydrogenase (short-subunit alcohol dehydrogenase family)